MRTRVIGREAEQAELADWFADACSCSPRVVVCTGDPGIGKTRLAEELADVASAAGAAVVWGFGDDTAGAPPYWVWRQALRSLDNSAAIPGLTSDATDDAARFRMFEALAGRLAAASAERPVLIVLEDLHWADEASLLLLRHVVRGLRTERLMMLATCRELTGSAGHTLINLQRVPVVRTLALTGLSSSGVRDALSAFTGRAIDDDAAESARELTGGNPLFLIEVSRAMRSGATEVRSPLTPTVREAIGARLANRSAECVRLVRAASLVGLTFLPDLAAEVVGLSPAQGDAALAEAHEAGLVEISGESYRFVHALIRETIAAGVEPAERAGLHRRIAAALVRHGMTSTGADVFTIARHWLAAGDVETPHAVVWSERAGDAAMQQLAYEDAARWYRAALRAGSTTLSPADRCRLLLAIGTATNLSGDLSGRLTACVEAAEIARAEGFAEVIARAALTMEPTGQLGFDVTIRRLCEEALAALPDSHIVLRARLTARYAATFVYLPDPVSALTASANALEQAEQSADTVAIAEACRARLAIAAGPGDLAERDRLAPRLAQIARISEDPRLALAAHLAHIDVAFAHGDLSAVATHLDRAATAADQVGGPVARFRILHSRAALAQARASFDEARLLIEQAYVLMTAGEVEARFHTRAAVLATIGRHTGQDEDTLAAAGYRDAPPGIKEGPGLIVPVSYAAALASAGRLDEARQVYRSTGPVDRWRLAPHVATLAPALGIAAASVLHAIEDLPSLAATLSPFADHHVVSGVGAITYVGPVRLWLGIAARHTDDRDGAVRLLTDAATCCDRNGARGYGVEARTELAETLAERGDVEDARAVAVEALRSARELGMAPYVARLEQLGSGRPTDDQPLTPRQFEVAELVADGSTNREIAELLTLSERTAENHVQHIMQKLGLPNRSGIAVWVTERRLSTPKE